MNLFFKFLVVSERNGNFKPYLKRWKGSIISVYMFGLTLPLGEIEKQKEFEARITLC